MDKAEALHINFYVDEKMLGHVNGKGKIKCAKENKD